MFQSKYLVFDEFLISNQTSNALNFGICQCQAKSAGMTQNLLVTQSMCWDSPWYRPHLTGGISVLKFIYTGIFIQTKLCCTGKLVKTSVSYICKITFSFLVYMTVKLKDHSSVLRHAFACFKNNWPIFYSLGIFVHSFLCKIKMLKFDILALT